MLVPSVRRRESLNSTGGKEENLLQIKLDLSAILYFCLLTSSCAALSVYSYSVYIICVPGGKILNICFLKYWNRNFVFRTNILLAQKYVTQNAVGKNVHKELSQS